MRRLDFSIGVVWCGFALLCMGCGNQLDRHDYVKWIRDYDHQLHVKKAHHDYVLDVQYTPADYIWLQRTQDPTGAHYAAEIKEIENLQYYTLTLGVADSTLDFIDYGVADIQEKQRKLYYFSYNFQDDITLEEAGTTLPCVLFHFEKIADLRHTRTFVLGFENQYPDSEEARLVISSPQFGSLPFKIKINKKPVPALAL